MKNALLILLTTLFFQLNAEDFFPQLNVTAQGKTSVKANIADIRLGIEVNEKTALETQRALSTRLAPVLEALKKVDPQKLETGSMNIFPEYSNTSPPIIVGYRGRTEILVSEEVEKAGSIIDDALNAGANQLEGITLRPDDVTLREARLAALQLACENALSEANTVMAALNIKSSDIRQVDIEPETRTGPIPFARSYMAASTKNIESTEILEQEQWITGTVSVRMALAP
jgi:uncharacterized protein YggE